MSTIWCHFLLNYSTAANSLRHVIYTFQAALITLLQKILDLNPYAVESYRLILIPSVLLNLIERLKALQLLDNLIVS